MTARSWKPRRGRALGAITPETIATIVGPLAEPYDLKILKAADARAARFMAERRGVIMGSDTKHHDAIAAIAEESTDPGELQKLEALLDAFDGLIDDQNEVQFAVDVALDRWTPVMAAAYYFGLAIGLRVAAHEDQP